MPPATPPRSAPVRRATRGAAGPIIPLPARVVIANEGQVARVAAPPVPERTDLDLDGQRVNPLSLEWSPAAATPPKAPATVPRPAPTYEQQIEIVGPKSETCRPGSAQCGGLKIRASAALPPNTAAATILPPFIISLFCLLLSQSPPLLTLVSVLTRAALQRHWPLQGSTSLSSSSAQS